MLAHLVDVAEAQHKKTRSFTTMHTASIQSAGTIMQNLHLPEESAIGGAYIENNSAVSHLTVYEGAGSGGRVIGLVLPVHSKRIALADHVSSISITADVADPSSALVIVTLSTHRWSPTQGSLT